MRLKCLFVGVFASAVCAASADLIRPAADAIVTTAAIQSAIDAAANLAEPSTVTLGAGVFEIDALLMVTGGVSLVGQGWENTVIRQTAVGKRCATLTIGGRAFGPFPRANGKSYVSGVRYGEDTSVVSLGGSYSLEELDSNLAKVNDVEYATVAAAIADAGSNPVAILHLI